MVPATQCIGQHVVFQEKVPLVALCCAALVCLALAVFLRPHKLTATKRCPEGSLQLAFVVFVVAGFTLSSSLYLGSGWVYLFLAVGLLLSSVVWIAAVLNAMKPALCGFRLSCARWRPELTFVVALATIPGAALLQNGIVNLIHGHNGIAVARAASLAVFAFLVVLWVCLRGCHDHVRVQIRRPPALEGEQPEDFLEGSLADRRPSGATSQQSDVPRYRASDLDLVLLTERSKNGKSSALRVSQAGLGSSKHPSPDRARASTASAADLPHPHPRLGRGSLGDALALASAQVGLGGSQRSLKAERGSFAERLQQSMAEEDEPADLPLEVRSREGSGRPSGAERDDFARGGTAGELLGIAGAGVGPGRRALARRLGSGSTSPSPRSVGNGKGAGGVVSDGHIQGRDRSPIASGDAPGSVGPRRPSNGSLQSSGRGDAAAAGVDSRASAEADLGWMDGFLDGVVGDRDEGDFEGSDATGGRAGALRLAGGGAAAARRDSRRSMGSEARGNSSKLNVGMYRKPLLEDYDGAGADMPLLSGDGNDGDGFEIGRQRGASDASSVWAAGGAGGGADTEDIVDGLIGALDTRRGSAGGSFDQANDPLAAVDLMPMYRPPSRLLAMPKSEPGDLVEIGTPPRQAASSNGKHSNGSTPVASARLGYGNSASIAPHALGRASSWAMPLDGTEQPLVGSMKPIPQAIEVGAPSPGSSRHIKPSVRRQNASSSSQTLPWESFAHTSMMDRVDWLSLLSFSWMDPLFFVGEKQQLGPQDLHHLPRSDSTGRSAAAFHHCQPEAHVDPRGRRPRRTVLDVPRGIHAGTCQDVAPIHPLLRPLASDLHDEREEGAAGRQPKGNADASGKSEGDSSDEKPHEPGRGDLSLVGTLWSAYGWQWMGIGMLQMSNVAVSFANPLLLKELLAWLAKDAPDPWEGVGWAGCMVAAALLSMALGTQFSFQIMRLQTRARAGLLAAVFRRALLMRPADLAAFSPGEVTNYLSVDVQKVMDVMSSLHQLWAVPVQLGVTLYLLYLQVRWAFFAGLVVVCVMLPLNMAITSQIGTLTERMMRHRDERVRLQSEMLRGVGEIKLASWEVPLLVRVRQTREKELDALAKRKYLDAMCVYLWAATPVLVSLATFATAVMIDPAAGDAGAGSSGHQGALSAATVFSAIALLNMLVFPMNAAPWILAGCLEAAVSIRRLGRFLLAARDGYGISPGTLGSSRSLLPASPSRLPPSVVKVKGSFTWPSIVRKAAARAAFGGASGSNSEDGNSKSPRYLPSDFVLRDLSLSLFKGDVVVVVSKVGGGKSALLQCILGELCGVRHATVAGLGGAEAPAGGRVRWDSRIAEERSRPRCALVTQTPWVREGTIRDNVAMLPCATNSDLNKLRKVAHDAIEGFDDLSDGFTDGISRVVQAFDPQRYRYALWASCLQEDLEAMPDGDKTVVGSRGNRLSGGQKARVAIARALYSQAPVLLIDDALRALDPHVASKVRARAFAKHASQLFDESSRPSMVVQLGKTVVITTNDSHCISPAFCNRVIALDRGSVIYDGSPEELPSDVAADAGLVRPSPSGLSGDQAASEAMSSGESKANCGAQMQGASSEPTSGKRRQDVARENRSGDERQQEEKRVAGTVRIGVLCTYCYAVGPLVGVLTLLSLLCMQLSRNGSDWWLAQWSAAVEGPGDEQSSSGGSLHAAQTSGAGIEAGPNAGPGTGSLQRDLSNWVSRDFLIVFGSIAAFNSVATIARAFLFAYGGLVGARWMHERLVASVFAAPMSFFWSTPAGRLTNRFSSDQYSTDETLPFELNIFLAQSFGLAGTVAVLAYSTSGLFLACLPVLLAVYFGVQRRYRETSRELKRCDTVTRSPLFSHFEESVAGEGRQVLRAEGGASLRRELTKCLALLESNQRASYASGAAGQWLGVRLQGIGVLVLAFVAFLSVGGRIYSIGVDMCAATASAVDSTAGRLDAQHSNDRPGYGAHFGAYTTALVTLASMAAASLAAPPSRRSNGVVGHTSATGVGTAGLAGLGLSYALPIVGSLQGLIGSFTETEKEFVSIERQTEYVGIAEEDDQLKKQVVAASSGAVRARQDGGGSALMIPGGGSTLPGVGNWPSRGIVEFREVTARYPGSQLPALRGVSFRIGEGSSGPGKLAVCGRTGSGKTSLVRCLMRMMHVEGGQVTIDGVDVRELPVAQVRKAVTVVSQEPLLLSGTVRFNLDPSGEATDDRLQAALATVGLLRGSGRGTNETASSGARDRRRPSGRQFGLDDEVEDGGQNWSQGEKQLLALARALVWRQQTRVVIVDEGTSSVDEQSDLAMQRVLQTELGHATTILIAHRVASLLACDTVLVMGGGRVLERGSPTELRGDPSSIFSGLLRDSGR